MSIEPALGGEDDIVNVVRHELAHIINWEVDGETHERKLNHQEWLDTLGAD